MTAERYPLPHPTSKALIPATSKGGPPWNAWGIWDLAAIVESSGRTCVIRRPPAVANAGGAFGKGRSLEFGMLVKCKRISMRALLSYKLVSMRVLGPLSYVGFLCVFCVQCQWVVQWPLSDHVGRNSSCLACWWVVNWFQWQMCCLGFSMTGVLPWRSEVSMLGRLCAEVSSSICFQPSVRELFVPISWLPRRCVFQMASYRSFRGSKGTLGPCRAVCLWRVRCFVLAENTVNYNVLRSLWYLGGRSLWGRKREHFLPQGLPVGQKRRSFPAPQGRRSQAEGWLFPAPQGLPVGQKRWSFPAPQGTS